MKLRVIEGGRGVAAEWREEPALGEGDLRREAARRLGESGYHVARIREMATGVPMPAELKYLPITLDFVVGALSRLQPIPVDFEADDYWPAL